MQVMGRYGRPPPARKACAWPVPRRLKAGTSSDVFPCAKIPLTTASHCSRLLLDPGRIAPTAVPVVGSAPPEAAYPRYPPGAVAVQAALQPLLSRLPPTGRTAAGCRRATRGITGGTAAIPGTHRDQLQLPKLLSNNFLRKKALLPCMNRPSCRSRRQAETVTSR